MHELRGNLVVAIHLLSRAVIVPYRIGFLNLEHHFRGKDHEETLRKLASRL